MYLGFFLETRQNVGMLVYDDFEKFYSIRFFSFLARIFFQIYIRKKSSLVDCHNFVGALKIPSVFTGVDVDGCNAPLPQVGMGHCAQKQFLQFLFLLPADGSDGGGRWRSCHRLTNSPSSRPPTPEPPCSFI